MAVNMITKDLGVAAASGVVLSAVEAISKKEHYVERGLVQAGSSLVVHSALNYTGYSGLKVAEGLTGDVVDSLVVGITYALVQKLAMKKEKGHVKDVLISTLSDLAAKEGVDWLMANYFVVSN